MECERCAAQSTARTVIQVGDVRHDAQEISRGAPAQMMAQLRRRRGHGKAEPVQLPDGSSYATSARDAAMQL
jgi:hypothetical protein